MLWIKCLYRSTMVFMSESLSPSHQNYAATHKAVFLTCQFQSINWSLYWEESRPNRLSAGKSAVINYWCLHGQELVFSHMLFLASTDDSTVLHGIDMWWKRKPSLRPGTREETVGEKIGSCCIQLSLFADFLFAKILHFHLLFNKAGKWFKEYKLAASQDHKKWENDAVSVGGWKGKQNPLSLSLKWEKILSRALEHRIGIMNVMLEQSVTTNSGWNV